jgi:hypothetical protein
MDIEGLIPGGPVVSSTPGMTRDKLVEAFGEILQHDYIPCAPMALHVEGRFFVWETDRWVEYDNPGMLNYNIEGHGEQMAAAYVEYVSETTGLSKEDVWSRLRAAIRECKPR